MKKRLYSLLIALACVLALSAQQESRHQKFSPEKFDAELQQFITTEAHLTAQEAARFFPVYKEMQQKQRKLYAKQRRLSKEKPADELGCQKAIQERDQIEVELKRVQEQYHNKFFELLSASKVYDVITAEDRFHRTKLKQWSHGPRGEKAKKQ